ncbi:MAG: DUF512 domain-containing protein, partial [Gemmatimonadota bacterium]
PKLLSVSVVPVGLTRYNLNRPVRLLTPAEAAVAIRQVERARTRALRERGTGWAYAGDELFLAAGQEVPRQAYYDDWPLTENGVGSVREFLEDARATAADPPRLAGRRVAIVTGARMGEVMAPLIPTLSRATGAELVLVPVENRLFGPTVTTAGLLAGEDMRDAVLAAGALDGVLIPAETLNDDLLFIDSMPYDHFTRAVGAPVVPAYALSAGLEAL